MIWVNFLHFYQPPSMGKETIDEVVKNSYSFIIKILKENRRAKITINVNASLLEHLEKFGHIDLIKEINKLALKGKIELVLSAAYHPVLALIPFEEALRQINLSRQINKKFFPKIKIKGFFFPEMVYDKKIAQKLKKIGIKWIILDELSYNGRFGKIEYEKKYIDKNSGLEIIFRNREFSQDYPPKKVLETSKKGKDKIIITGTDAELYGDRHIDFEGDFYWALKNKNISVLTVSDFLKIRKEKEFVNPKILSWDTTEKKFQKGEALYLWNNPKNNIHKKLWELTYFAVKTVENNRKDKAYKWARWRLDRGISSCVYWWASEGDVGSWSLPAWHPDQIIIGAKDLVRSIRSLENISVTEKLKAEKLYLDINRLVWKKHWTKYYRKK